MYICENCNKESKPTDISYKIAIKTRKKIYSFRSDANRYKDDGKLKKSNDPGGSGLQIVTEITICNSCKDKLQT